MFENELTEVFNDILKQHQQHQQHQPDMLYVMCECTDTSYQEYAARNVSIIDQSKYRYESSILTKLSF